MLGCAVPLLPERPLPSPTVPELLELVATGPGAPRVKRARLGCPSETRLLASPKMQRLLTACRYIDSNFFTNFLLKRGSHGESEDYPETDPFYEQISKYRFSRKFHSLQKKSLDISC